MAVAAPPLIRIAAWAAARALSPDLHILMRAIRRKLFVRRFKRLKYLRGTIYCRSKPVSRDGAMNFSR
jgi:hypothetical protein